MRALIVFSTIQDPVIRRMKGALQTLCGINDPSLASYDQTDRQLCQVEAELVIVCLSCSDSERGLKVIKRLRQTTTGHLFAVGQISEPKLILRAMQAGADLFLDQAELETELQASLNRVKAKQEASAPGRTPANRALG